ncbi:MAG: glycosyltransferase family 4 protein [Ignavibacteria bacterium]|nr:glycosyltransferase family 4 protein [Ignavibacteria bacterium]
MRVLVISHTYITRIGREKWRVLQNDLGVELRIVVPRVWKDYLFTLRYADQPDDELSIDALPVCFSGKEAAHVYRSATLGLRGFAPDILHVEEGTDALSYFQALRYKALFAPRAKTVFFTWMNFEKNLRFPFPQVERHNLRHSDAAICGNRDARDILLKKGFKNPVHVLPLLGIDPELFRPDPQPALRIALGLDGVVIGFLGRFVPEKGVLDLIEAASRLSIPFTLLFVGGGDLEQAMREAAAERGIADNVRIVPSIPHAEVPKYLNAIDVLVLPSFTVPHWKEQFGQILVQGMCCEIPVLGSTHAEIPHVIGDAGLTFTERSVDDLHVKLRMLVESADLRREFGSAGRRHVLRNYTNDIIARKTLDIYTSLLQS